MKRSQSQSDSLRTILAGRFLLIVLPFVVLFVIVLGLALSSTSPSPAQPSVIQELESDLDEPSSTTSSEFPTSSSSSSSSPLLLEATLPAIPYPTFPLSSLEVRKLLEPPTGVESNLTYTSPWSGLRPTDEGFNPEGKYVYVSTGGDLCAEYNRYRHSLECRITEAAFMGRTLVLDSMLCYGRDESKRPQARPLFAYIDLERMRKKVAYVPLNHFRQSLDQYLSSSSSPNPSRLSAMILPNNTLMPNEQSIGGFSPTLVIRHLADTESALDICKEFATVLKRDPDEIRPRSELWEISATIASSLNQSDYAAVHVRRGEKARDKKRWPHLDDDTKAEKLLKTLPKRITKKRTVYISSDETKPGFFAPLKKAYDVHVLADYAQYWAPGSKWHRMYTQMEGPGPVFDSYMQAIVDYGVYFLAKQWVETFNDLTKDPSQGIKPK